MSQFGTGNLIPDPIPFVDVKAKEAPPKQGYKSARFIRSSTRIPGVKHSPSAVGDITRALGQQPAPAPRQSAAQPMQMSRSGSQPEAVAAARPQSRSANRASNPNLAAESAAAAAQTPSPQQPHFPTPPAHPSAPPHDAALSPSRFSVSPSANLRARPSSEHITPASTSPAKPGHMSAGAFQNRLSLVSPSLGSSVSAVGESSDSSSPTKPARYEPPAAVAAKEPSSGPFGGSSRGAGAPPANGGTDDDENDPLLVALKALQAKPPPSPSRQTRSSVDLRGAAASPTQQQPRPASRGGHNPQQSFGSAAGAARSRPTSPAPAQAFMQPPPPAQQRPRSPSIPYMQPSAQSRPHSRAGSNVSAAHLTSPPPSGQFAHRPASPSQHVPARGRSPSPQPFIPESLRPASPNPAMQAQQQQQQARSPSVYSALSPQQPTLGYGAPPPQQQPPQQQYGASNGYGAAPPPPQASYGHPAVASSNYGHGRATSPAPQGHGAPYHQPPPLQQQPYIAQAPSQPQLYQSPPPSASPYQQAPPPQQHAPPTAYGYAQPPPAQQQQQVYARSPSVVGGYGSPASSAPLGRTNSMLSGVSGASTQQTPAQIYQSPLTQQQQQQQQQVQQPMQQARPPSVADLRAGQAQQPPPTGQHTETGQPILFYVRPSSSFSLSLSVGPDVARERSPRPLAGQRPVRLRRDVGRGVLVLDGRRDRRHGHRRELLFLCLHAAAASGRLTSSSTFARSPTAGGTVSGSATLARASSSRPSTSLALVHPCGGSSKQS